MTSIFKMSKMTSLQEHLGVSKNSGTPKWMVYNGKPGKPYEQMDDLGFSHIFGNTHLLT